MAGTPTTAASEILRDNVASRDAETVARLRAAGAIVVGKLNTHEFAFGALTTSPHFGPARNPWSPDRVCGGSSGGSGGRGRCRPGSRGARHRHRGLDADPVVLLRRHRAATVDRASSRTTASSPSRGRFDTVGPLARTAEDCSLLLEAIAPAYRPEPPEASAGFESGSSRSSSTGQSRRSRRRCGRRSPSSRRSGPASSRSPCRCSRRRGRSSRR